MALAPSDIKFYLSGGAANTDPDAALGGAISTTEAGYNALNALFDEVTGAEATAGEETYRCIYVKNTNGTTTLPAARAFLVPPVPTHGVTYAIAIEAPTAQTIANESTAPTALTFSAPTYREAGLAIGNLAAGATYAIWVRRTISADAPFYADHRAVLSVENNTAL